jgi:hypothetical protein
MILGVYRLLATYVWLLLEHCVCGRCSVSGEELDGELRSSGLGVCL